MPAGAESNLSSAKHTEMGSAWQWPNHLLIIVGTQCSNTNQRDKSYQKTSIPFQVQKRVVKDMNDMNSYFKSFPSNNEVRQHFHLAATQKENQW